MAAEPAFMMSQTSDSLTVGLLSKGIEILQMAAECGVEEHQGGLFAQMLGAFQPSRLLPAEKNIQAAERIVYQRSGGV
jgi:hypothetical protein